MNKSPNDSWTMTVKEVCGELKIARSKYYYLIDPKSAYYDPTFPKPARIGKGSVRLDRRALMAWYSKQQGADYYGAASPSMNSELPP